MQFFLVYLLGLFAEAFVKSVFVYLAFCNSIVYYAFSKNKVLSQLHISNVE